MSEIKEKIQKVADEKYSGSYRFFKNKNLQSILTNEEYSEILQTVPPDLHFPVSLMVHCYMSNVHQVPKCACGNVVPFNTSKKEFAIYCSNKCKWDDNDRIQEVKRATNIEKYGAINILSSEYGMNKARNTLLKKYGVDNPYNWKNTFKTEEVTNDWDDTGEEYSKDVLEPNQVVHFKTEDGTPYIWYAKQNRYNDKYWEIAFGVVEKDKGDGSFETNIEKTGKGNAFRIFATVIDITNYFVEYDGDNYEVQNLTFSSKGQNRTSLYKKYLVPRIENFEISHEQQNGEETEIHLQRNF
jgi:hypothetical protein